MRPLRIVHIAGTENGASWLIGLLREQRRRGHDARAALRGSDGSIAPILEREGIPYDVVDIKMPAGGSVTVGATTVMNVARYLRKVRPDIVHYHLFPAILIGRLGGWLGDAPLRFSMIPGPLFLESPMLGNLEAETAWADTRVIATCEKTRTLYVERGVTRDRLELVYYGVDETKFDPDSASRDKLRRDLGIADDAPVIGMVAYFYPPTDNRFVMPPHIVGKGPKGHETLFAAIPQILAEFPNAKFVLVGKGWGTAGVEYEQSLRKLVLELGLGDAVIFSGERTDIPDTLAAFDIAIQCSLSENLGGSIEGLLMARPMVVTRVGGFVDSVIHEETGLLVPHSDPPALAEAILRLLRDPAFAAQLGANGRRRMLERFTLRRACDDLDEIYERCMREIGCAADGLPRELGYRRWRSFVRLPQLPFRVAPVMMKMQMMRVRSRYLAAVAR